MRTFIIVLGFCIAVTGHLWGLALVLLGVFFMGDD